MPSRRARIAAALVLCAAAHAAAGCGVVRSSQAARTGRPAPAVSQPEPAIPVHGGREAFEHYVTRVRALSRTVASGRQHPSVVSVETADPVLRAALAGLSSAPTSERYRTVAIAYRAAGIDDRAFDYYTAAVRLDRTDAAAYDGLARIWRDWGVPQVGLVEAHRAIFHAPASAAARNTLGTLLQGLGQVKEARAAYEASLRLDPQAAYALSNLCALDLAAGRLDEGTAACQRALSIDPVLFAARRNLASIDAAGAAAGPRTAADVPAKQPSRIPPGE